MTHADTKPDYDALVIGGGITGIYQVYLLDMAGMSVLGVEAAEDVGGTWYWNRYPGCRLDTESYAYGYFALNGIIPDWKWSENFAGQPEMLRYVNAAADAMGVRRHYRFNSKVSAAHFQDVGGLWKVTLSMRSKLEDGDAYVAWTFSSIHRPPKPKPAPRTPSTPTPPPPDLPAWKARLKNI